jgi:hypothetical protein
MGRTRDRQYALTRSLQHFGTNLPIYQVSETGTVCSYGVLHLLTESRHWLQRENGPDQLFHGLPYFALDMSPQGYVGRNFSTRWLELGLPVRIKDWSDDHRLLALARRGEDCVGNLIIGKESLNRFLADKPHAVVRDDYPRTARASLSEQVGSSAAGEQPKFAVYSEGRHVLVKFADRDGGAAGERWKDLLVCEKVALEAVRAAGILAATATWFDIDGCRFLEVERFDRVGFLGRRGIISLLYLNAHCLGSAGTWTKLALQLIDEPGVAIDSEDVRRIRWLDTFGQLIGNNDRHFGNLSFFIKDARRFLLQLTPVYDMLPMIFAPEGANIVDRCFTPQRPTADNLDVWADAAHHALTYWNRLAGLSELSGQFRELTGRCSEAIAAIV